MPLTLTFDGREVAEFFRGVDATAAVALNRTLIDPLPTAARNVAAACPTGAFALKEEGGCSRPGAVG